jgi:hypothetical protein
VALLAMGYGGTSLSHGKEHRLFKLFQAQRTMTNCMINAQWRKRMLVMPWYVCCSGSSKANIRRLSPCHIRGARFHDVCRAEVFGHPRATISGPFGLEGVGVPRGREEIPARQDADATADGPATWTADGPGLGGGMEGPCRRLQLGCARPGPCGPDGRA